MNESIYHLPSQWWKDVEYNYALDVAKNVTDANVLHRIYMNLMSLCREHGVNETECCKRVEKNATMLRSTR